MIVLQPKKRQLRWYQPSSKSEPQCTYRHAVHISYISFRCTSDAFACDSPSRAGSCGQCCNRGLCSKTCQCVPLKSQRGVVTLVQTYLCEDLVALGKASVHVLLLGWQGHDVVGLKQSSSGVHQLQRVVVWRRYDAPLRRSKRGEAKKTVQRKKKSHAAVNGAQYLN